MHVRRACLCPASFPDTDLGLLHNTPAAFTLYTHRSPPLVTMTVTDWDTFQVYTKLAMYTYTKVARYCRYRFLTRMAVTNMTAAPANAAARSCFHTRFFSASVA